jgi:uncharacterized membrane protein
MNRFTMNNAHFHLLVNHLPIVGILIGILALLFGMILRKPQVKATALGIFVFSAITAAVAFFSGEGAEDAVENLQGVSESLIHTHEELAETFLILALLLGAISLVSFLFEWRKSRIAVYLYVPVLLLAFGALVMAKFVGTSGGEIRHTEIRGNANVIQLDHLDDDD